MSLCISPLFLLLLSYWEPTHQHPCPTHSATILFISFFWKTWKNRPLSTQDGMCFHDAKECWNEYWNVNFLQIHIYVFQCIKMLQVKNKSTFCVNVHWALCILSFTEHCEYVKRSHLTGILHKNISDKLQLHSDSRPVTHTRSTCDWMWPHTISNNCLHSLKDFPRQKCLQYQYCPSLPPLPAVLWYHIWSLCAQGDFQPLKWWAGWEWASDLWAAFYLTVWE